MAGLGIGSPTLKDVFLDEDLANSARNNPDQFSFPVAPHIHVVSDAYPPHVYLTEDPDGTLHYEGGMLNLLNMLAQTLNFTYELSRPPDGSWGQLSDDGTWSGMVGQLFRKEKDMALGPFIVSMSRYQAVSFTPAIVVDILSVAAARESPKVNPWNFMLTYTGWPWFGILMSLLAFAVLTVAISAVNSKDNRNYLLRIIDVCIELLRVLVTQVIPVKSSVFVVRVIIGCWLLFSLIVMRSYCGALVSMLAVRNIPIYFKNLEDIVTHPTVNVIIEEDSAITQLFRNSKVGYIGQLGEFYSKNRIIEKPLNKFYDALLSNVVGEHDSLLVSEILNLATMFNTDFGKLATCQFYVVGEALASLNIAMAIQKDSPIVYPISSRLLRYHSMGLYEYWLSQRIVNGSTCYTQPTQVSMSEPYNMDSLWGIFAMGGCGLTLGCIVFLLELLVPNVAALKPFKWVGLNVLIDSGVKYN